MYYRFQGPDGVGLFMSASPSLFGREVPRERVVRADRLREWLWRHTPSAEGRAYRTPTPGTRASTWFVGDARAHIRAAWELSELLGSVGAPIWLLRSERPGEVVFRDEVQVVVWSGQDLPRGIPVPRYRSTRAEAKHDRSTIRRWRGPRTSPIAPEVWARVTASISEDREVSHVRAR